MNWWSTHIEVIWYFFRFLIDFSPTGSFQLLKYLLDNYDKSPARRNQKDIDGNTLLHHVTKSPNINQENYAIALKLLLNYKLDMTIKNNEGKKAVNYLDKSSPLYNLLAAGEKKRSGL